jgi:hypothetical protein
VTTKVRNIVGSVLLIVGIIAVLGGLFFHQKIDTPQTYHQGAGRVTNAILTHGQYNDYTTVEFVAESGAKAQGEAPAPAKVGDPINYWQAKDGRVSYWHFPPTYPHENLYFGFIILGIVGCIVGWNVLPR